MTTPIFLNLAFLYVRRLITSEIKLLRNKEIIDKSIYKSIKPVAILDV